MWIRSRITSGISSATSTRTRRFLSLLIVSFLLVLLWQNYPIKSVTGKVSNSCLDVALFQFLAAERRGETSISRVSHLVHSSPAAVLGNGHIGVDLYDNSLLFADNDLLSLSAAYSPQLSLTVQGQVLSPDALVFEYKEATFHYIYAHSMNSGCLQARHSIHVHREKLSLIVQDIKINNGAPSATLVGLKQLAITSWSGSSTTRNDLKPELKSQFASDYLVSTGQVKATLKTPAVNIVVASVATPNSVIEIGGKQEVSAQFLSAVHYQVGLNLTEPTPKPPAPDYKDLTTKAVSDLESFLMAKDAKALEDRRRRHVALWGELWQTMPRVLSKSHPSTPGNAEIFACLFYLMAYTPYTSGQRGVDSVVHDEKECFSGPPTMHTTSLWLVPHSRSAIDVLVRNWHRTLSHGACDMHIFQGVQLLGQVVTLSFLGLRHVPSNKYLDLALNPALIQADALVHNLYYANHRISIHIRMDGGAARKMLISAVALKQSNSPPLYACPASCSGTPRMLQSEEVALPVVATKPVTPLLYISTHLNQLATLQNKSRELQTYHLPGEVPHHEWGVHTVSPRVWLLLGVLLTAFHVFLLRMVCNEYCPEFCSAAGWQRILPRWMLDLCSGSRNTD